jgi:hypothetical protein
MSKTFPDIATWKFGLTVEFEFNNEWGDLAAWQAPHEGYGSRNGHSLDPTGLRRNLAPSGGGGPGGYQDQTGPPLTRLCQVAGIINVSETSFLHFELELWSNC